MQPKHDWQVESRLLEGRKWAGLQAETRCGRYHYRMRDPGGAAECASQRTADRGRLLACVPMTRGQV